MKPKAALPVIVLALLTTRILADSSTAAVRKQLESTFKQFAAAFKRKDLKAVSAFFAPDYTAKLQGATVTRAQMEAQMKQQIGAIRSIDTLEWTITKLTVNGKQATTVATETFVGTVIDSTGQLGQKGQAHVLKDVETLRDTFIKSRTGWLLKHSETLAAEVTIDGKKIGQPAAK